MLIQKRHTSAYIPYRKQEEEFAVFLQRRTADAPTNPGYLGLFGGGIEEGEDAETALVREAREELGYTFTDYEFVGTFESETHIKEVFIEKTDDDFENRIQILEGEYGRFFTEIEVEAEEKMTPENREIIKAVFSFLQSRKNSRSNCH